jgi:hybrid cluster-associated redox disulfide protein
MKKQINKKMTFAQVMKENPEAAQKLMESGLACCGCPMAMQETLEQGATAHGINPDKLVTDLNKKKRK